MAYIHGDFKALGFSDDDAEMFGSAFRTITDLELWDWLRTWSPPADKGFMFCDPPDELKRINVGISKTYDGHSGASYGATMRAMESIAKHGWFAWADKQFKHNTPTPPAVPIWMPAQFVGMSGMVYPPAYYERGGENLPIIAPQQQCCMRTPPTSGECPCREFQHESEDEEEGPPPRAMTTGGSLRARSALGNDPELRSSSYLTQVEHMRQAHES